MPDTPQISREELHRELDRAEARSIEVIEGVKVHFDQRLKDSERVLTWRMIATMGVGSTLTVVIGKIAGGNEPVRAAVGQLARLMGV